MSGATPTPDDDLRTWRDAGRPTSDRDAALGRLVQAVKRMAARVAKADTDSDRAEFIHDAPALVLFLPTGDDGPPRVDRYDGTRPLLPWLKAVLRNAHTDEHRRRKAIRYIDPDRLAGVVEPPPPPEAGRGEDVLASVVGAMNVLYAVEFLSLSGWHALVPADAWDGLVGEYERRRAVHLPRPFPGPEMDRLTTTRRRSAPLARLLGYEPNRLAVRWKRAREQLGVPDEGDTS